MHLHCTLDKSGYRHIPRICNTFYCSKAAVVMQMFLSVMFIHSFSVLLLS